MMTVWSRRALRRLDQIHDYIAQDNPQVADQLINRLLLRSEQLTGQPWSGRMVPEYRRDDVRELIDEPYRIICQVKDDRIEILTVRHGAQRMPPLNDA